MKFQIILLRDMTMNVRKSLLYDERCYVMPGEINSQHWHSKSKPSWLSHTFHCTANIYASTYFISCVCMWILVQSYLEIHIHEHERRLLPWYTKFGWNNYWIFHFERKCINSSILVCMLTKLKIFANKFQIYSWQRWYIWENIEDHTTNGHDDTIVRPISIIYWL